MNHSNVQVPYSRFSCLFGFFLVALVPLTAYTNIFWAGYVVAMMSAERLLAQLQVDGVKKVSNETGPGK
jgi:hypothetical protein